jgi:hypothetical protein
MKMLIKFNKGYYLKTLSLLAMEEELMEDNLESSMVFKGSYSDIENDLIVFIIIAINVNILCKFCQADQMTDVSLKVQLSIIVRYVYGKCVVVLSILILHYNMYYFA